jgi:hypothetical protein
MLVISTNVENQKKIEEKLLKDETITVNKITNSYQFFELGGEMEDCENRKIIEEYLWFIPYLEDNYVDVEYFLERQDDGDSLNVIINLESEELSESMEFEDLKMELQGEMRTMFMYPSGDNKIVTLEKSEDPSYKFGF